jgi:hypothetical protein
MSAQVQEADAGLTKSISVIYLMIGCLMVVMIVMGVDVQGVRADWHNTIWLPALIALMAFGTIRRTRWGRWLSYVFSFVIVFGMPTGTLLGGYMLWHLTKFRAAFNRWY